MKLYTGGLSPYSAKVRMQIYAMNIAQDVKFELPVSFFTGKFSTTSPIGRIPVLETDDGTIGHTSLMTQLQLVQVLKK